MEPSRKKCTDPCFNVYPSARNASNNCWFLAWVLLKASWDKALCSGSLFGKWFWGRRGAEGWGFIWSSVANLAITVGNDTWFSRSFWKALWHVSQNCVPWNEGESHYPPLIKGSPTSMNTLPFWAALMWIFIRFWTCTAASEKLWDRKQEVYHTDKVCTHPMTGTELLTATVDGVRVGMRGCEELYSDAQCIS